MSNTTISHKCIKHQDPMPTKNRMSKTWSHLCLDQYIIQIIHHKIRGAIITWIDNHSSDKYDDRIANKFKWIYIVCIMQVYIYNEYTNL